MKQGSIYQGREERFTESGMIMTVVLATLLVNDLVVLNWSTVRENAATSTN